MAHTDWWLVVPTIVLAIFTGGLFAYTARLAFVTARLAKDAGENAQRQLRAYVSVGASHFGEKYPTAVTMKVRNGGQTPAYKVTTHLNRQERPVGELLGADFTFPDFIDPASPFRSIAVLNAGDEQVFTFPISLDQLNRVQNGEIGLFFYGHAEYIDIFERVWRTNICYQYTGEKQGEHVLHRLMLYQDHNDAT
jgi:hypothetical protein